MLLLTRHRQESIVIIVPPSNTETVVEIFVADVRGSLAKLGLTAPKSTVIHRKEIFEAIREEQRAADSADAAMNKLSGGF